MAEGVVLVIDDEPGIIRLCQRLLDRAGFRVMAVTRSQDGIAILEQENADLLLVDIRMPGLDGFQVIDQARRRQPDIAVVIMTGFGTVEMAIEALRRGADGLILKPFAGAELVQSVKRALQENQNKRDVARLQALRPLFDVTETLFAEPDPARLRALLLEAVCGHLRCGRAALYHRKAGGSALVWLDGRSLSSADNFARRVAERAETSGMPLWINCEGPSESDLQALLAEACVGSILCVPVSLKDGNSVLAAARGADEPAFRASDLEMFAILARQATVAMENASLNAELRANIRQLEESQRALIQAEKLATVGRLTASIAHEINNPLQAVQNCLHLAARQELSLPERQSYLEMAQRELNRLMRTVQRMLEFYRPGALDRKPTDMNELLQRVLGLVEHQLNEQKIRVQTRLSPRLPVVMVVNDQIQQVFLNLMLNAMQAMPEGGDMTIRSTASKREIEVLVEDSGPGVPPEERKHIFEPFVSTKERGSGLGLAVSYGIVTAHGGSLDLVTGRGRGACFRVTLPLGEAT
jgi:signal transduction histidine kinase/FixJ family two-component response regulator